MQRFLIVLFLFAIGSVRVCAADKDVLGEQERKLDTAHLQSFSSTPKDKIRELEVKLLNLRAFLAHTSHELRNPLNGLLGMLNLINLNGSSDTDSNYIKLAKSSSRSMLEVLNDILDILKIEAGELKLESIPFEIHSIAHDVIHQLNADAHEQDTILDVSFTPEVPKNLKGDPTRLRQILSNVVRNVVRSSKAKLVSLSLNGVFDEKNKDLFWLIGQIKDTSIGMSQETLEALFNPFIQADASILRKFEKTGLGLVVAKELCEAMKGEIKIISEPNRGSIFQFKVAMKVIPPTLPVFPISYPVPASPREKPTMAADVDKVKELKIQVAHLRAFLAYTSHALRDPLNGLLGMLNLIDLTKLSDENQNSMKHATNSGRSMLEILDDILDFSKIEAGELKLESIPFEIRSIAQDVMHTQNVIYAQEAAANPCKQGIGLDFSVTGVPLVLEGDPNRLRQILSNLVRNAVKFTKQGSVFLSLDGTFDEENKELFWLVGQVKDTGIGMNKETLNTLFKPFTQADVSTLRKFGGTGLGLVITKELCERMRGKINVTSELNVGSTFWFKVAMKVAAATLPAVEVPSLVPVSFTKTVSVPFLTFPGSPPIPATSSEKVKSGKTRGEKAKKLGLKLNLNILIAEDTWINQEVLKRLLIEEFGCTVAIASNGEEAIRACTKERYDLILMDGEMPIMGGLEASQEIRKKFFTKNQLPIIGVSAHAMVGDREVFLSAGMNGYITKPIDVTTLKEEIFRCIPHSQGVSNSSHNLSKIQCYSCGFLTRISNPPSNLSKIECYFCGFKDHTLFEPK